MCFRIRTCILIRTYAHPAVPWRPLPMTIPRPTYRAVIVSPPTPSPNQSIVCVYVCSMLWGAGSGDTTCASRLTDGYRYRYGDTDMRPSRLMLRIGRHVSKDILSVHTDMVREPHSASRACIYSVLVLVYCHCAPWYIRTYTYT